MEKINPRMVTLARESRGMVHADLGRTLNVSAQAAWYLEQDFQVISETTLSTLSKALEYSPCFFYQQGEVLPLPLSYRKRNEVSAKLITQIDAVVNIYRINLEKLLLEINYKPKDIPSLDINKYGTPQNCAKELRKIWKIKNGPIENLSELLENHKIILLSSNFDTEKVDGKCTIAADKFPMIVTNSSLLGDRQRFTLAYHLGYLVMHWQTSPDFERNLSHEANLFAAEFLMPEKDINADLKELSFGKLPLLKSKWKSSMISLLYRSEDVGLTTENQKRYILEQFNNRGIKRREPKEFDIPIENYSQAKKLINLYKQKENITKKQLAEFFCMEQHEFEKRYNLN